MRVLIFESSHEGHVLSYLRLLIPAICEIVDEVVLAIPKGSLGSEEFRQQLAPLSDRFILHPYDLNVGIPNSANLKRITQCLLDVVSRVQPEHIYVPHADGIAQNLGIRSVTGRSVLPRHIEAEGLMFRGGFAYPQKGLKAKLKAFASWQAVKMSRWAVLHYADPIPFSKIQNRGGNFAAHCSLMPDPVEPPRIHDPIEARRLLGLPEKGRYIGFGGGADFRKGADLLLRSFAQAKLKSDDRLLMVGRLAPEVRALVDSEMAPLCQQGRLIILDRYVSDEELQAAISAMDVVCTPYPQHIGSASFVIRAAAAGRPVLGSNYGWIGWAVQHFGLGRTCDVRDLGRFSEAIHQMLDDSHTFQLNRMGEQFVQFHSVANFTAAWTKRIQHKLGIAARAPFLDWSSVVQKSGQAQTSVSLGYGT